MVGFGSLRAHRDLTACAEDVFDDETAYLDMLANEVSYHFT
jgi:hypothetical protein